MLEIYTAKVRVTITMKHNTFTYLHDYSIFELCNTPVLNIHYLIFQFLDYSEYMIVLEYSWLKQWIHVLCFAPCTSNYGDLLYNPLEYVTPETTKNWRIIRTLTIVAKDGNKRSRVDYTERTLTTQYISKFSIPYYVGLIIRSKCYQGEWMNRAYRLFRYFLVCVCAVI